MDALLDAPDLLARVNPATYGSQSSGSGQGDGHMASTLAEVYGMAEQLRTDTGSSAVITMC